MKNHAIRRHSVAWTDLSPAQRLAVMVAAVIQVALLIAALQDIRKRSSDELRGSKGMWAAISFINFVGPLAYFLWGRQPDSGAP